MKGSTPQDNSTGGSGKAPKRRRSQEMFPPAASSLPMSLPTPERAGTTMVQAPPTDTTVAEQGQPIYDNAKQFDESNLCGLPAAAAGDRQTSRFYDISAPMGMQNFVPMYHQEAHPDMAANEEAVRHLQAMMPATLPNLSILGNMLSNTSQKYDDKI